jgi:hypothetical protein
VTSRPWRRARVISGALFLGAVGAALAPGGPGALVPFKLMAASAADQIYVAVVVDFGNGTTTKNCVPVTPGESDLQALNQVYPVGTSNSGLVCTINGVPVDGVQNCTATENGEYIFWSYWHGTSGTWSLAGNGPAGQIVSPGDVEGWHFLNPGPLTPPPSYAPGAPASYALICGAATTPTTTPPTTQPPTPAAPTGTTGTPASGATVSPTTSVKGSFKAGHASTTTTGLAGSTTTSAPSGAKGATSPTLKKGSGSGPHHTGASALASHSSPGSGGGNPILPIALIGAVIVALGALGYFRWRRRPAEE